jgi:hypothetical protein
LLIHTPSFKRARSPPNESIDRAVFDQILELDDDDDVFSKEMVDAYFVQADKTFNNMDAALCVFAVSSASSR